MQYLTRSKRLKKMIIVNNTESIVFYAMLKYLGRWIIWQNDVSVFEKLRRDTKSFPSTLIQKRFVFKLFNSGKRFQKVPFSRIFLCGYKRVTRFFLYNNKLYMYKNTQAEICPKIRNKLRTLTRQKFWSEKFKKFILSFYTD